MNDSPHTYYSCAQDPLRQNTEDDTWVTLGLAMAALPISLYFLAKTWISWRALHRPTRSTSPPDGVGGSIKKSPSRRGANASMSSSKDTSSESGDYNHQRQRSIDATQSSGSAAGSMSGEPEADWTWVESVKYWFKKLFRPRTVNQLIGNLLLCSWIILAADQFFHALFIASITFTCPAYNCRDYITFATPNCAAGPLEAVQLIIQPFGSCLFVVATVNRFVNVYSKLSRRRFIALRIGTLLVCFVCMGMSAITALTYVLTLSETTTDLQIAEGQRLLVFGDFITYQTLGIVAVFALVMGLQYIYEIRKEISALKSPIATPSIFNAADTPNGTFSFLAVAVTAPLESPLPEAAPSLPGTPIPPSPAPLPVITIEQSATNLFKSTSSLVPQWLISRPYSLTHSSSKPKPRPLSALAVPTKRNITKSPSAVMMVATLQRAYHSDRRKSAVTVACILVNIAIIISFLFQHPYVSPPPAGAQQTSTLLDLAILSLVQKVFAAVATIAIQHMTDLVLANKRGSG